MLREWKGSGLGKLITICIYPAICCFSLSEITIFSSNDMSEEPKTKMNELELANKDPKKEENHGTLVSSLFLTANYVEVFQSCFCAIQDS